MKKILVYLLSILLMANVFAEMHYVEITGKPNVPTLQIKSVSDFETIIKEYNISIAYLQIVTDSSSWDKQPKSITVFVIAQNTYFSFDLENYKTLGDYHAGKAEKYEKASDYYKSKELHIDNATFYYYYVKAPWKSTKDAELAYNAGFPTSKDYYSAKELNYTNYKEYKEYLDYTGKGFKSKPDYQSAITKGFSQASEYYISIEQGFLNYADYKEAHNLGLETNVDFTNYTGIIKNIEKIMTDRKLDKKSATIYYFIQTLPRGEQSLSILSKSLQDVFNMNNIGIKRALSMYVNNEQFLREYNTRNNSYGSRNQYIDIEKSFEVENLKGFFNTVNIDQLGSYSSQSEIFKRK